VRVQQKSIAPLWKGDQWEWPRAFLFPRRRPLFAPLLLLLPLCFFLHDRLRGNESVYTTAIVVYTGHLIYYIIWVGYRFRQEPSRITTRARARVGAL